MIAVPNPAISWNFCNACRAAKGCSRSRGAGAESAGGASPRVSGKHLQKARPLLRLHACCTRTRQQLRGVCRQKTQTTVLGGPRPDFAGCLLNVQSRRPGGRSGQNCPGTSFDSGTSGVMLLMSMHLEGAEAPGQRLQAGSCCQTHPASLCRAKADPLQLA